MRTTTVARAILVALTLSLGLAGCGQSDERGAPVTSTPVEDTSSQPSTMPLAPSAHSASFSYLEGVWTVTASLAGVDDPALAATITSPAGDWELTVLGDSMTAHLPALRYEGLLEAEGEGWSYLGFVTGTGETGEMLMGSLEFRGALTGDDTFSGGAMQSVDATSDRPAYTARWDITGVRRP